MTEAEWQQCKKPEAMLKALVKASERKLRLFAVACCYHIWQYITSERSRNAVHVAERFADGNATKAELDSAEWVAVAAREEARESVTAWAAWAASREEAERAALVAAVEAVEAAALSGARKTARAAQADLVRDIFNPWAPPLAPSVLTWDGGTVPKFARVIYDGKHFDRMPILADAMEEAGCADPSILSHCRGPGPHVRGCWLVDLILAKE